MKPKRPHTLLSPSNPTPPGDLNYRCQVFVGEILGKIAAASEVEKARRGWPPYSGHAWRDDSYNRFFLPPPRRRLPAEAAGRGITSAMRDPGVMEAQGKARGKARRREEAKEVKEAREAREREREGEGERRGEQATASENGWETAAEVEREGSGSGSEGGSVASAHSLADLLAVMRDADCPMTTRDDVAAQEDPGARHWAWACEVDELSLSRKAGVALFGFQEGPLAFPPTFKFFPGRLVEDYADVTDLRYGYQVTKGARALSLPSMSDGGGGSPGRSRPPSWTDRILYHSLPGLESRLLLEAYDTCDAITGSDHRPVVAAFQLLLDKPANNKPSPLTTGGPILPAPSPPPSLFFPEALPSISEQPQKQPPQPQQPQPPAPPGPGDRPPRRIEQPGPAEEFKEEPAAPAPPRPASLGTAASAATGGGGGGGSGGLPLVRRATPPGPPPAQMARMSTTASSVGGGGGGGAGFQPLVPPSTTKSVLVSVRLANFAFRFKLPRKPELQIAGQQKKGKRGARGAAVAGPTAEERESGPTEGSEEEGQQQQQRQEQGRGRDHGQRQADTEVEVFEAPSAWRARRATAGQQQREGSESESESGEDFPPDVPALAIPTDTSSYVTPQLAHNPPSYTRQRTMPIPSRVPLRAFWSIGAAGAEAAASLRRMGEQRAAEAPAVPTDEDIGWVVVMMPIPCEDPLIGHRRIVMMMDDPDMLPPPPTGNGAAATAPRNGKRLGSWLWPSGRSPPASAGAAGEAPGPLEAGAAGGGGGDVADAPLRLAAMAEEEEEHARQHVHRFAWADVQARGRKSGASSALRVEALVVPAGGMHAAFKFLDKKGRDLGQGVVCMKEVVLRGRVGPQRVTMQLSVGGVHFGEVAVDVVIKSRTGALGPAAAGMSRASSFGTLGAAAVAAAAAVGGGPGVPVPVPRVGDAEEGERGEM